ncbi:MAG: PHP domain-containing protein [Proteobacteria bacterium]|nr:PHP domain-containing protein [Pseudomonadota bacterium]
MCIDLHTHSIYSDGSCTPAELVALAVDHGLRGLALTDHDTVEGVEETCRLGTEAGLTVISGVEISTSLHQHTIHILGYGFDPTNPELHNWLIPLQEGRERRNAAILQKLRNLGIDITAEEVETVSCCGQTGRPHIARLLVAKGVVDSFNAAFRYYLGRNRPAWQGRFSYSAVETIAMIHRVGGLAVLAHPGQIDPEMSAQPALVRELADSGLDGLELHYPTHTHSMKKHLKALAIELELLVTGGSDFHGTTRPVHRLAGKTMGFCPPCEILSQLTARLAGRHHQPFSVSSHHAHHSHC